MDIEPPPCRGEAEGVAGGGRGAGRSGGEVCPRHCAGVVDVQVAEEACQGGYKKFSASGVSQQRYVAAYF